MALPNNRSHFSNICLKKEEGLTLDPFAISEVSQKFYSNLASNLVEKPLAAVNKFGLYSVEVYYKNMLPLKENKFTFQIIESSSVLKLLQNVEINKAVCMNNTPASFLKDCTNILAIPEPEICNLSLKLSHFLNNCKLANLKPLYKKGFKTDSKKFRPISLLPRVSRIL